MPNIDAVLTHYNIEIPSHAPGRYYTTCPYCSAKRKPNHQKLKVLGVTITGDGHVHFGCNHCHITGPEQGVADALPHYDYGDNRKTRTDSGRYAWSHRNGKGEWETGAQELPPDALYRIDEARECGGACFVCEGEKDADNLWNIGFAATCHPHGAGNWTTAHSEQLRGLNIVVLNDNDEVGYTYAGKVVRCSLGVAASVRRLDLKNYWPEIGEGEDVSDWLNHGGGSEQWLERIIDELPLINGQDETEATGIDQQPSRLVWFKDIKASEDSADFVQGLLVEHSFCVVYGASGSGKTFWTTTLALNLAAGLPFAGLRVEPSGVTYCVLEGNLGFANRVDAWRRQHHMVGQDLPFAAIPHSLNMMEGESINRLCADCKAAQAKMSVPLRLIIIDTLARALAGGNENAPDDMGRLVMHTDYLRRQTGAAVLYIHHCGKNAANGARGHSSLQAAVDTEIEISVDELGQHTAALLKQRDMTKGWTSMFTLKPVDIGFNKWDEKVTTCVVSFPEQGTGPIVPPKKLKGQPKQALELLVDLIQKSGEMGHPGVPDWARSVPEQSWRDRFYSKAMPGAADDTKQKAFRRAADTLIENQRIECENGRVWHK